jgi:hypothetical protein
MTRFGDCTAAGFGWPDSVLDYVFAGNKRTLPIFFYMGVIHCWMLVLVYLG